MIPNNLFDPLFAYVPNSEQPLAVCYYHCSECLPDNPSIEKQKRVIRAVAADNGYHIYKEYTDVDNNSTGLTRLLDEAKSVRPNYILVYSSNMLFKDADEYVKIKRMIKETGCKLIIIGESTDDEVNLNQIWYYFDKIYLDNSAPDADRDEMNVEEAVFPVWMFFDRIYPVESTSDKDGNEFFTEGSDMDNGCCSIRGIKLTDIKTRTFSDNGYCVDIVMKDDVYEAWVYREDLGVKHFVLGLPREQISYRRFMGIVEAEMSGYRYICDHS